MRAITAETHILLHAHGRELLVESTGPDGFYPKACDLECVGKLRQLTGARFVPMHQRMWGSRPSDLDDS